MKRLLTMLLLSCLLLSAAYAETAPVPDYYAPVNPRLTKLATEGGQPAGAMLQAQYMTANEVWCAYNLSYGGNAVVLERRDKWGYLRETVTLSDLPGTDHEVMCIARVGDRLLIGLRNLSLRGTVIVLDAENRELLRTTMAEDVGVMSMKCAPEGILCSGFTGEGTQDCLYLALVNGEGQTTFESRLAVGEAEVDMSAVAESLSCAGKNGYYVMLSKRTGGLVHTRERAVVGFDAAGQVRWEEPLPEDIVVHGMAAGDGVVYLYGYVGPWDEARAWAGAWSEDGECLWRRFFERPDQFVDCIVDEAGCWLLGRNRSAPVHVAVLTRDGEVRELRLLQFSDAAVIRGWGLDAGALFAVGYLYGEEKLFMMEAR